MSSPPEAAGGEHPAGHEPAPQPRRHRWSLHLALFVATGFTTTLAGVRLAGEVPAAFGGEGILTQVLSAVFFYRELLYVMDQPSAALAGLAFSVPLLGVFLTHEMGHFVVARLRGVDASLPYFIPVPFALGTLGAVIGMRAPSNDRGALVAIGAAGPLVGFVVAFVVLLIGFSLSEIKTAAEIAALAKDAGVVVEGDSLSYALARWLVHGTLPPGDDVWIHNTAYAGWFGMYLTWFNLLPFSQFDGGHISYALVGRHARTLSIGVLGALLVLFVITFNPLWVSLCVVLLLLSRFIGLAHPPINDDRPMRPLHKLIAFTCALVFIATFVPNPLHPHPGTGEVETGRVVAPALPADDEPPRPDLILDRPRPRDRAPARDLDENPLPKRRDPRAGRPEDAP